MTDSEIVTSIALDLDGVWIHNPNDPQGTVKRFVYTDYYEDQRHSISVDTEGQVYSGRTYPVFDISPHEEKLVTGSVTLLRSDPYFPESGTEEDLEEFVRDRQYVMYRDGSGRFATGPISNLSFIGYKGGRRASFNVHQASIVEVSA